MMKIFIFSPFFFYFLISFCYAQENPIELPLILKNAYLAISKEELNDFRPHLLKIEKLFLSNKIKNPESLISTEFFTYSLKNPIQKNFNRYPFTAQKLKDEKLKLVDKIEKIDSAAKNFCDLILGEIKLLERDSNFILYMEKIKTSYYFTSDDLKKIDKKLRFLEPWWDFFLTTPIKEINITFAQHLKKFLFHLSPFVEVILNEKISIEENAQLALFEQQTPQEELPLEQKIDQIVDESENESIAQNEEQDSAQSLEQAENNEQGEEQDELALNTNSPEWRPEDNSKNIEETVNLNLKSNYPKPTPNYIRPENLPIPLNDW